MNDDIILYWVLGILIWGLIWGVVTKSVSSSKGYNDGFAWGFFLGIIGLIVVACRPNKTSSSNSNSFSNNYQYYYGSQCIAYCGNCGFPNRSDSVFCLQCGSKLPQSSTNIGGEWKCKCGAQNYSYETSCHRCGEKKPFPSENSDKNASSTSVSDSKSITEQLEELKKLQEQGLITEADFDAKKNRYSNYNSKALTPRAFLIDSISIIGYNINADERKSRRKFGVKMNTDPFKDTTQWLDGSEMPQVAVDHIIRSIRLTYYTYTALILLPTVLITCVAIYSFPKDSNPISFGIILFWLPGLHFLRSGIKHVRILKKREFLWVEGVTGGIFAPKVRGEGLPGIFVRTDSSEIMIKNHPLHSTLGWKKEGVPVYSVMFNTYGRGFLKGGFLLDPIVFKNKN